MVPVRARADVDLTSVLQGLRENTAPKQGAARLHFWVKVDTKARTLFCCAFMPFQLVKSCCLQVASCLTWLPILSVSILLVVMMYGLVDSVALGAALSALKRTVLVTLPDLALMQISSVALMTAAVCAAFAEV